MKRKRQSSNDDISGSHSGGSATANASSSNTACGRGFQNAAQYPSSNGDEISNPGMGPEISMRNIHTLFPDICPGYVATLYKQKSVGKSRPSEEDLIDAILEKESYRTLSDTKRRKLDEGKVERKIRWGDGDNVNRDSHYWKSCKSILKLDFPLVPPYYCDKLVRDKACLYKAYLDLDNTETMYETLNPKPYRREKSSRRRTDICWSEEREIAKLRGSDIGRELQDARDERRRRTVTRALKEQEVDREAKNLAAHAATGGLVECCCCYTDTPLNRMVSCTATDGHLFCKTCMKSNAESQIGMMKYKIHCMDMSGCTSNFTKDALVESIGDALVNKIADLEQRDEIEKAGIEGLEECPFCDYKEIYPPVEEDREFRCQKPGCRKVSCRKCHETSHIPKSCEEMQKEKRIPIRQKVEEAMSEAIIRICPNQKCRTPIIKDFGCNKMWCTKCGKVMCYICKKDITQAGYQHFTETTEVPGRCMLHDSTAPSRIHADEALKAHRATLEQVMKENPDLKEEDIGVEAPKVAKAQPAHPNIMHLPGHHQQYLLELLGPQPLQPQPQLQPAPGAAQQQPLPPQAHNPRQILFHRNEQPLPPQPVPVPVQLAGHPLARLAEAQQHHPAGQNIQVINQPGIVPVANYNRDRFAAAQRQLFPHERMRMPIQFHNPTTGEIREIYEIDAPAIQPGAIFQPPQNFLAGVPPPAHNPNHPHPPPIRTPNTGNQPGSEQPPARPNVENHAQNFAMHYVPHYGHPNGGQPHAR